MSLERLCLPHAIGRHGRHEVHASHYAPRRGQNLNGPRDQAGNHKGGGGVLNGEQRVIPALFAPVTVRKAYPAHPRSLRIPGSTVVFRVASGPDSRAFSNACRAAVVPVGAGIKDCGQVQQFVPSESVRTFKHIRRMHPDCPPRTSISHVADLSGSTNGGVMGIPQRIPWLTADQVAALNEERDELRVQRDGTQERIDEIDALIVASGESKLAAMKAAEAWTEE
jgi:hypothetical protein